MRYIVLDTETTGLEPDLGHRIVEIGCVEIVNRQLTGRHFHTYLNPERDIDEGALDVHGLTREMLSNYPVFAQKADEFLDFIRGAHIIIHNAPFDLRFLDAELQRLDYPPFQQQCAEVIDSLAHARELHPGKRNSLDALCERYGISNAHRTLHGALLDAELLAEVWLAMTRGQNALLIDMHEEVLIASSGAAEGFDYSGLPVLYAQPEEIAAHESYLEKLAKEAKGGKVLWRELEGTAETA